MQLEGAKITLLQPPHRLLVTIYKPALLLTPSTLYSHKEVSLFREENQTHFPGHPMMGGGRESGHEGHGAFYPAQQNGIEGVKLKTPNGSAEPRDGHTSTMWTAKFHPRLVDCLRNE